MRRSLKGLGAGLATALVGVTLAVTPLGLALEKHVGLEWLFNVRGPVPAPEDVVIVAIDARTGQQLGLSDLPRDWPRTVHARVVENLVRAGVSAIVFDIDFSRSRSAADDAELARAIAASGRVVLFERLEGKQLPVGLVQDPSGKTPVDPSSMVWIERRIQPVPVLADAAKALAPFPLPKVQESVYQYWTFKPSAQDTATLPAAALQVHAIPVHQTWLQLLARAGVTQVAQLPASAAALQGPQAIASLMSVLRAALRPPSGYGDVVGPLIDDLPDVEPRHRRALRALLRLYGGADSRYLNFYGPAGTVRTIPYHEMAQQDGSGASPVPDLRGKVAFIGFSDLYDPGQPDRFYTVFTREDGVDLSGVEIAATGLGNLLDGTELRALGALSTLLVLLAFGLLLGWGFYVLPALVAVPAGLLIAAGHLVVAQRLFSENALWLPIANPILVQLPLALFVGLLAQYLFERAQKHEVTRALSYYLPEDAIGELTRLGQVDRDRLNKNVYATCFATDMAGFSTIAETMSPGELAAFMNEYFEALSEPLKRHGVDVVEFRADAIMCAWTAQQPEERVRRGAVLAGLGVVEAIHEFSARRAPRNLAARVGLECGWVYVGHAGGGGHFVYSIVGDCANSASRLESLNKHLHTRLLASAQVVSDLDDLLLRPLGEFILKGKSEPVSVVEILSSRADATPSQMALCERYAECLAAFRLQRWSEAERRFAALLAEHDDDGPSRFYQQLCRQYQHEGPPRSAPTSVHMSTK